MVRSLNDDHRTFLEIVGDQIQVGEYELGDICSSPTGDMAEQDDRGIGGAFPRQEVAEVGVGRNQHALLIACSLENHGVGRCCESVVTHMYDIVSVGSQQTSDLG